METGWSAVLPVPLANHVGWYEMPLAFALLLPEDYTSRKISLVWKCVIDLGLFPDLS